MRAVGSLLMAALVSLSAPAVLAQSPAELKRARAQFQRGTELEKAGNYSEAIQQFREVGQVRMTPQVRFHIAFCEEGLGRLVTALGGYGFALAEADQVGPDFRNEVETAIARLKERIPKVLIERGTNAEAALVQIDGVDVGASSIGVEVPLDPGPHTVTASAPGYKPFTTTAELVEREVTRVTIELEEEPVPVAPPPKERIKVVVQPEERPNRTIPYIVGGAGIVSLLGGGALFALRQSTLADLEDRCPNRSECPESNEDAYNRVKIYGIAAPIAAGVGVAAIGTAVALIVFEKKPDKPAQGAAFLGLRPFAPDTLAGASWVGSF